MPDGVVWLPNVAQRERTSGLDRRRPRALRHAAAARRALALVVLAASCRPATTPPVASPLDPYSSGLAAGARGEFGQARHHLDEAIRADPRDIAARRALELLEERSTGRLGAEAAQLVFRGLEHQARQDWPRSRDLYAEALRHAPDHYWVVHNLATAHLQLGDVTAAIAGFERVLHLKPGYPYAHNNLGLALAGLERHEKAVAHYRKAIEAMPGYHKAYNNLGASLSALGRSEEAAAMFRTALELKPDYALAFSALAYEMKSAASDATRELSSEALAARLATGSPSERREAVSALRQREDPATAQHLTALLRHEQPFVRAVAASVIHADAHGPAADELARLALADPDWVVRREATQALVSTHDPRTSVPTLIRVLRDDKDHHVRQTAAWSLGRLPATCASSRALGSARKDSRREVREAAESAVKGHQSGGGRFGSWEKFISELCS